MQRFQNASRSIPVIEGQRRLGIGGQDVRQRLAPHALHREPGLPVVAEAESVAIGVPILTVSAVTGEGIEPLKFAIADLVVKHRGAPIAIEAAPKKKRKPNYPPLASSARGRKH